MTFAVDWALIFLKCIYLSMFHTPTIGVRVSTSPRHPDNVIIVLDKVWSGRLFRSWLYSVEGGNGGWGWGCAFAWVPNEDS